MSLIHAILNHFSPQWPDNLPLFLGYLAIALGILYYLPTLLFKRRKPTHYAPKGLPLMPRTAKEHGEIDSTLTPVKTKGHR